MVESSQQRCGRKDFDPRRGQLDGEGEPIQAPADLSNGDGVLRGQGEIRLHRLRSLDEEPNGVGRGNIRDAVMPIRCGEAERGDRDLTLPGDAEANAAGDQHRHVGTRAEKVGHIWSGLDDLLEVIEQEQETLAAQHRLQSLDQRLVARLAHGERLDDGGSQ